MNANTHNTSSVWRLGPTAVGVSMLVSVAWGWSIREERYITADEGIGYWLGLTGLGCMTILLFYSVRKRLPSLSRRGHLRRWLSVHMMLGLVGPLLVVFHSNFRLGSLNSTVALACVLVVALSGVIGRMLYPRIHHRLTGHRATLSEVRSANEMVREGLNDAAVSEPGLADELAGIDDLVAKPGGVAKLLANGVVLRRRARSLRRRYPKVWKTRIGQDPNAFENYVRAAGGVLSFRLYERLFALWHSFHLPFCFVLFGAAAVHVLAVHLY